MERSKGVRDAMLRFYDGISNNDVSAFDALVSEVPATLVIGTAHEEWVTERASLRFDFEAEALSIEAGAEPSGYAEGDLGWFVDRPVNVFGDLRVAGRLTSVLRREVRAWRIVHMHVPVGVPDEEVGELQQRWSTAPAP